MVFGQFAKRDGPRDLVTALGAHGKKSYHLGLGKGRDKGQSGQSQRETRLPDIRGFCPSHDIPGK